MRAHYDRTRLVVNDIAEQNDPGTTFEMKRNIAYTILTPLNDSTADLTKRYAQLDAARILNELLDIVSTIQTVNLTQLEQLITAAQQAASPVVALAAVSEEVEQRITREIYASIEVLMRIESDILPCAQSLTDNITDIQQEANISLTALLDHVSLLEEQLLQIMNISITATNLSNTALTTAQQLASVYSSNLVALAELEEMVAVHGNNVSSLKVILQNINLMIMERQAMLEMIRDGLPTLPSEETITSLQQQSDMYLMRVSSLSNETRIQNDTLSSLTSTLEDQSEELTTLQEQLESLTITIGNLTEMIEGGLNDTLDLNTSAYNCIAQGQMVLSILQNYNDDVKKLQIQVDQAVEVARTVNNISRTVENRVNEISLQLQDAVQALEMAKANATLSQMISQGLLEVSSSLVGHALFKAWCFYNIIIIICTLLLYIIYNTCT